jgi:hypothetical protein
MSDKKQTAVQWLYDELSHCLHREEVCDLVYKLEQKALEMEREQIVEAVSHGWDNNENGKVRWLGEQYYKKTYGGKE